MDFHSRWDGSLHLTTTRVHSRAPGVPARSATSPAPVPAGADRLARIGARVRDGFYATTSAMDALASCLLASTAL